MISSNDPRHCEHGPFREDEHKGGRLTCAGCGYVLGKDGTFLLSPLWADEGEFAVKADLASMKPARGVINWKRPTLAE